MVAPPTDSFINLFIPQTHRHVVYTKKCARHLRHKDNKDIISALDKIIQKQKINRIIKQSCPTEETHPEYYSNK